MKPDISHYKFQKLRGYYEVTKDIEGGYLHIIAVCGFSMSEKDIEKVISTAFAKDWVQYCRDQWSIK